jgi:heme/copper-type cytochrome/quinol oxidase subunit 3
MSAIAAPRAAKPNGWWGMAVFVATESTLFGVLVGTYVYLRFNTVSWPPLDTPEPKVVVPVVLALVLATTSVPMALAARAARRGLVGQAWSLLAVALVVQSAYFGVALHQFTSDLDAFTPQRNAYGSIYYTLLGADHAHVAAGLLLNAWLLLRLVSGLTRYRTVGVRAVAFYWHAVNVLTLVVTLCLLSPRL